MAIFINFSNSSAVTFLTDIGGTKYEEAVIYLTENGIVEGYPDNTFRPHNLITRAEITTIITKLNHLELVTDNRSQFNDISTHWAKAYINTLANAGFVSGYGTGEFRPNNDITYGEIVTMLLNSLGYKDEVNSLPLKWPKNYINMGGILQLFDDWGGSTHTKNFSSTQVTRGEAAILIYNSMNITERANAPIEVISIKNTDSEYVIKEKVAEYLDILQDCYSVGLPSFRNINEADEKWIFGAVDEFARRSGFSHEQYITKARLEQIKTAIFGESLKISVPKNTEDYFKELKTNSTYSRMNWREYDDYGADMYIEEMQIHNGRIIVKVIPYKAYYGIPDLTEWIDIHGLNNTSVVELRTEWALEDIPQIVAQYKDRFPKNLIELEIDQATGRLYIVSCEIVY